MKKSDKAIFGFGVFFIITGLLFLVGYVYANFLLNKMDSVKIDRNNISIKKEVEEKLREYDGDITNIALFGIDAEEGTAGRSDAIMIATVDTINKTLKLTSIMRDSYVNIPDRGMDKINHAYAFGGPELAISTLNENFDLNIKDFVAVNFTTLPIIVDMIGGIEIEITDEEAPNISGINAAGVYNLTGDQALSYTRIRHASGDDYKRTERQRTVLSKIFDKVSKISPTKYPGLLNDILPMVTTSLPSSQILDLASEVVKMNVASIEQERFPLDGYCSGEMIDDIYYLTFDKENTVNQIHSYIFENKKVWNE